MDILTHEDDPVRVRDFDDLDLLQMNSLSYVAGFFVRKIINKHECNCNAGLISSEENNPSNMLISLRNINTPNSRLLVSSNDFKSYIYEIDQVFLREFEHKFNHMPLIATIFPELKKVQSHSFCDAFPIQWFLKLFLRTRIYYILKFANRNINEKGSLKMLIMNVA